MKRSKREKIDLGEVAECIGPPAWYERRGVPVYDLHPEDAAIQKSFAPTWAVAIVAVLGLRDSRGYLEDFQCMSETWRMERVRRLMNEHTLKGLHELATDWYAARFRIRSNLERSGWKQVRVAASLSEYEQAGFRLEPTGEFKRWVQAWAKGWRSDLLVGHSKSYEVLADIIRLSELSDRERDVQLPIARAHWKRRRSRDNYILCDTTDWGAHEHWVNKKEK